MDLAAFLGARLDEDEATARAILTDCWGERRWAVEACAQRGCKCIVYQGEYKPVDEPQVPPIFYIADAETTDVAAHIARHDPARVLREVAAGRVILAAYQSVLKECATMLFDRRPRKYGEHDGLRIAVLALAAAYSDHPDYDPAWAVSG